MKDVPRGGRIPLVIPLARKGARRVRRKMIFLTQRPENRRASGAGGPSSRKRVPQSTGLLPEPKRAAVARRPCSWCAPMSLPADADPPVDVASAEPEGRERREGRGPGRIQRLGDLA